MNYVGLLAARRGIGETAHSLSVASVNHPLASPNPLLPTGRTPSRQLCLYGQLLARCVCFCPKEASPQVQSSYWGQYVIVGWCLTHLAHYAPTCRAYSSSLNLLGSLRSQVIPLGPTPPLPCLKLGQTAAICSLGLRRDLQGSLGGWVLKIFSDSSFELSPKWQRWHERSVMRTPSLIMLSCLHEQVRGTRERRAEGNLETTFSTYNG